MNWQEKIIKILRGKNASALATTVGLYPTAISQAVAKGQMPGAGKAIKIARALGVSVDWLFDDDQDWPPPSPTEFDPKTLPDVVIVEEILRRKWALRSAIENSIRKARDLRSVIDGFSGSDREARVIYCKGEALMEILGASRSSVEAWEDFDDRFSRASISSLEIDEIALLTDSMKSLTSRLKRTSIMVEDRKSKPVASKRKKRRVKR